MVEKPTALICQIREHLNLSKPRYSALFADLFNNEVAMKVASTAGSPQSIIELGFNGLIAMMHSNEIRNQNRTIEKILARAHQAVQAECLDEVSRYTVHPPNGYFWNQCYFGS